MKLIDKYIIKKFLTTFFFMLGVVMLFSVVFDISARLSEFIENKATIFDIVFKYYANFILFYGNTFSFLIIFLAVIWFTAKMAQEAEIIPLLFSGRPFLRIMRPYFIAATILVSISLIMNHFVLPRANKVRLAFEEQFYRDRLFVENYHAEFPGNKIVHFSSYLSDVNMVNDFKIEHWSDSNTLNMFLSAKTAQNEIGTHKWTLHNYYLRKVGYPHDQIIKGAKLDTILKVKIDEMAMRDNNTSTMTFNELKKFIAFEEFKGNPNVPEYKIELYNRTALPFATYVLTIIGIAVSARKKRGGIGINIAIGLLFVFVFIFSMQVTSVAAIKVGFPPLLATWIPNIIFAGISLIMYRYAPK